MPGKYIVFEGMNGAGKSTLAHCLTMTMCDRGAAVASLVFPGRLSPAGKLIRDVFEGRTEIDPRALLWLFVAEGVDLEARIKAMLDDGTTVICDRHTQISARVYQPALHDVDAVHDVLTPAHLRAPDFVYIVDVPITEAIKRRTSADSTRTEDPFDFTSQEKTKAERQAYLDLVEVIETWWYGETFEDARHVQVRVLDGTRPIEENVGLILDDLEA